jgi:hypothetical protein
MREMCGVLLPGRYRTKSWRLRPVPPATKSEGLKSAMLLNEAQRYQVVPIEALCLAERSAPVQQIRGSCSPESMSTTRVPPTRVFMVTNPG